MENKIFTYNGRQYRMRQFDLGLLNKAAPLLLKYRKLLYEYTKDIDLAEVREAEERITELKTAIDQLKEAGNKTEADRLSGKLKDEEAAFAGNRRLQSALKLYNDCTGLSLYCLITDGEIINPFLKDVLSGFGEGETNAITFLLKYVILCASEYFQVDHRQKTR